MALTVNTVNNPGSYPQNWVPSPAGGPALKIWVGSILGDASYPTGGYTMTPSIFGMTAVHGFISGTASNSNTVVNNAGKLQFFVSSTGAEVANTTNLSAVSAEVIVIGQ